MPSGELRLRVSDRMYSLRSGDCLTYRLRVPSAFETNREPGAKYPILMVYRMTPSGRELNDATALVELPALPRIMHDWVQDGASISFILPFSPAECGLCRRAPVKRLIHSLAPPLRARGQTPKFAARG